MIQFASLVQSAEVVALDAELLSLTFIANSDYEFVGGGTAVNGL